MDAALRANFLGATLIVCVNAFIAPQSAGQMAAFAKTNRIPVAVWELANKPYFFKQFSSSDAGYVARVRPCRDAIKAAGSSRNRCGTLRSNCGDRQVPRRVGVGVARVVEKNGHDGGSFHRGACHWTIPGWTIPGGQFPVPAIHR